jgi:hypothetical protein
MMRLWTAILFWALPTLTLAEPARVTSGDHDGFSRLVVELTAPGDWRFGRQSDGYALVVDSATQGYDLGTVFDLIGRERLAAVSVSPSNGNLLIGLACACHAIPFEFRPGVIVIDIREGPPPAGSSFEEMLDPTTNRLAPRRPMPRPERSVASAQQTVEPATANAVQRDAAAPGPAIAPDPATQMGDKTSPWVLSPLPIERGLLSQPAEIKQTAHQYDWLAAAGSGSDPVQDAGFSIPLDLARTPAPFAALHDDLLAQISRGAARGVVDLATPRTHAGRQVTDPDAGHVTSQVVVDPVPGMSTATTGDGGADLTATGTACIPDTALDLAAWGRPGPVSAELWSLSSGLVGEFDAINTELLRAAIRFNLHLGFGAEAAHMVRAFPDPDLAKDATLWTSLGKLVDGRVDPDGPFADMMPCDTAAALWAVLSREALTATDTINTDAVLRSFSALPAELRLSLGPGLADRFMALDRADIVRAVWSAVDRSPEGSGSTADLIDAQLELAQGAPEAAADLAKGVIKDAGPDVPKAMLALVEADLAQGKPIDAQTTNALQSLLRENQGAELEAPLARALILALASNGDADMAFALLADHPEPADALWTVLAELGADSDVLTWAIGAPGTGPEQVTQDVRRRMAERLLALGFARPALDWLGPTSDRWSADDLRLAAKAQLALDIPVTALDQLQMLEDPAATAFAAQAQLQAGDAKAAANLFATVPDAPSADHALIVAQDWAGLSKSGPAPWKDAAAILVAGSNSAPPAPPLAEAAALLSEAASTRESLTALLLAVQSPTNDLTP